MILSLGNFRSIRQKYFDSTVGPKLLILYAARFDLLDQFFYLTLTFCLNTEEFKSPHFFIISLLVGGNSL